MLHRSSRTGRGAGTAPAGKPTTTVRPSDGPSRGAANEAVLPSVPLEPHGVVAPAGPA
jgi:hypothetical protein